MTLLVSTRQEPDGTTRIRASGEIDLYNAHKLREATDQALADDTPWMIAIDLSAVSLVDNAGIGVLVSCYHTAAAFQVPLVIANPAPPVHRQLWTSGLAGLLGMPTTVTTPEDSWLPFGEAERTAGTIVPSGLRPADAGPW